MSKFDLSRTISKIQASFKNDERRSSQFGLGNSLESVSNNPNDYVVLPDWFKSHFGIPGIKFGHFVQIAGEPDSGKTSLSLLAMKNAQEQGHLVIYAETEGKTGPEDLIEAGINPDEVIIVHTKVTEEVYDGVLTALDAVKIDYPEAKILLVIDSYGNTISMRDSEIDMTEKNSMVGGAAKTNRTGLGAISAKQITQEIAVLVVNYTYDNIGSVGKTNAGGKALNFHCMLTFQSSRTAWYDRTVQGQKVRAGADVIWKVYKNHYAKALKDENGEALLLPKEINLRISSNGFEVLNKNK